MLGPERPRRPDVLRPGGGAVRDGHAALGLPAGRHQGLRGQDRAHAASQHERGRGRKGTQVKCVYFVLMKCH